MGDIILTNSKRQASCPNCGRIIAEIEPLKSMGFLNSALDDHAIVCPHCKTEHQIKCQHGATLLMV
jgi:Zn finger protein HypA/HybF involved in hydrogenase expression